MKGITTHILDVSLGLPATAVSVRLEKRDEESWLLLGEATTDADGRALLLLPLPDPGEYRLGFDVGEYFRRIGAAAFYPAVQITFLVTEPRHYHVPLLLSPFGFSTYRGT